MKESPDLYALVCLPSLLGCFNLDPRPFTCNPITASPFQSIVIFLHLQALHQDPSFNVPSHFRGYFPPAFTMADFTSKIKGAVDKATSAAKEMAQETGDMKNKPDQNPSQEDSSSYSMAQDQMEGDEQYSNVSEFDMSPMSQDSQVR